MPTFDPKKFTPEYIPTNGVRVVRHEITPKNDSGYGGHIVYEMPVGGFLRDLYLHHNLSRDAEVLIERISLMVGRFEAWFATPEFLRQMDAYKMLPDRDGILHIPFGNREFNTFLDQMRGALHVSVDPKLEPQPVTLKIKVSGVSGSTFAFPVDGEVPEDAVEIPASLETDLRYDFSAGSPVYDGKPVGRVLLPRMREDNTSVTSKRESKYNFIFDQSVMMKRIWIDSPHIDRIDLIKGEKTTVSEYYMADHVEEMQERGKKHDAFQGMTLLDFTTSGDIRDFVPIPAKGMKLKIYFTDDAPVDQTIPVLMESVDRV